MRTLMLIITVLTLNMNLIAQYEKVSRTNFVAGLAGSELLHAGLTFRLANSSLLGLNVGAGPTMGGIWPAISLEHRLYLGRNDEKTGQKTWFFRQGTTYFPTASATPHFTLNLTGGKDIPFRNIQNGITIDAGVFYLADSEDSSVILIRSLNLWPALRVAFYFGL